MHFLDGATRAPSDSLGHWIDKQVPHEVSHLRIMSGYFALSGLGAFQDIIDALNLSGGNISAVLGANDKETIESDLIDYLDLVQSPRAGVRTAIASYSNGLFHPKVYHLTRTDGSELAYVGSANLTDFGVNSGNIEAGIILDTREKDDSSVLSRIAASVDTWFSGMNPAVNEIISHADVRALVAIGIVGIKRKARSNGGTGGSTGTKKPSLSPVVSFGKKLKKSSPTPKTGVSSATSSTPTGTAAAPTSVPPGGQEVLVSQIPKGGDRWNQGNFSLEIMKSFFGIDPAIGGTLTLYEIDTAGNVAKTESAHVFQSKSHNYRFALRSVNGRSYPASGRPIAVFRRLAATEHRYRVLFPGDTGHSALEAFLNANYTGRGMKRVATTSSSLATVWSSCPV
ncbi:MAG: phospholipase D family protein [Paracoccaceae bacterium]